jgi:hypothetical protein
MRKTIVTLILGAALIAPVASGAFATTSQAPGKIDPKIASCLTSGNTNAVAKVGAKGQCTSTTSTSPTTTEPPETSTTVIEPPESSTTLDFCTVSVGSLCLP